MFNKVLIANRGEIALRIIRSCKELGIKTVAIYSTADENSLHVHFADESVCIGPAPATESYLDFRKIIGAAEITGADAIHPGYGFLAENAAFADACEDSGIVFIGPNSNMIRSMGDKVEAKRMMKKAGVPVVPGSDDPVKDENEAWEIAEEIGFPVIIKAASGGGGKGMRIVYEKKDFLRMLNMAMQEAKASFGDERVYIEKYIENPRHIEFQMLADNHGNVIHLGERECSIQRRHQKLLEESPSPVVSSEMREKMGGICSNALKEIGYRSAGTMEFIYKNGEFYFIEMNTRIQVEHPVTEWITGIDIVKEQIKIAYGDKLSYSQKDVVFNGHSIECRINAEDPDRNFMPSPGKISSVHVPGGPGVRVDTHVYGGYSIPGSYDSMVAKLITWGHTREEARLRMLRSLDEFVIEGIKTTIPFHKKLLQDERFIKGEFDTGFIERMDK